MVKLKFETVLFDFIEPLVVLYKTEKNYFFSTAMPSQSGFVEDYLLVRVSPKYAKRYFREECDLRYLFEHCPNRKFFKVSASKAFDDHVVAIDFEGDVAEDLLPDSQFFASSHTQVYKDFSNKYATMETVYIDGNWEMEDFGSFSSKYRDLYAFEESLNKLRSGNSPVSQIKAIRVAYRGSLKGGGGYVNFFRDLLDVLPANERYQLSRVQYASPGNIVLQGKGDVFDGIENLISTMLKDYKKIEGRHAELRQFMSKSKVLDVENPVVNLPSEATVRIARDARSLLEAMGMPIFDDLFELTDRSSVNTAKLAMALFRRVRAASSYFAEGRASFDL